MNLEEAKRPYCLEINGEKIFLLSYAEREYNYATEMNATQKQAYSSALCCQKNGTT